MTATAIQADENNYLYTENQAINKNTGEISKTIRIETVPGTIVLTPEQQEQRRKAWEVYQNRAIRKNLNRPLGNFFFIQNDSDFGDITPATLARLIYLNTYLNFENNQLMLKKDAPMYRKDLIRVLKISKGAISKFWHEVSPKYIMESESGLIFTNNNYFFRGYLNKTQKDDLYRYRKFFIRGIRKLYHSVGNVSQHKHLGYIFQMLPFINIEYNVLCHNPLETDYEKIEPLTLQEFCKEIGYNISQVSRLLNIYKNIVFCNGQRFCNFVNDGLDRNNSKIFINPHVLYSGSNYANVEVLDVFTRRSH